MLTLIWIILTTNLLCVQGTNLMHIPCDDKVVEKLSRLATTYINEDRKTGYKFALNRVTNVQAHPQVGKLLFLPVKMQLRYKMMITIIISNIKCFIDSKIILFLSC